MHECPDCGQACDCIGDDTWDSSESLECVHECDAGSMFDSEERIFIKRIIIVGVNFWTLVALAIGLLVCLLF